jgi:hypothetical protein
MLTSILILWMTLFSSSELSSPVRHFSPVPITRFPRAVFLRDFCEGETSELDQCWASFRDHGGVWAASIDQSHVDALLVSPSGDWRGTLGEWYFLYRRQGKDWTVEKISSGKDDEKGWQTSHPRFDVLPTLRNGHHDLRVVVDGCLKWDGAKYMWYEPEDYRRLSPEWFNAADHREAEIFWAIRYAGLNTMTFEPQWFPLPKDDFRTSEEPLPRFADIPQRVVVETLEDPQEHIRWVGMQKGGVWGIRGERVFLLAPQISYTVEGIDGLRFEGDWLLASGETQDTSDARKSEFVPEDRIRPSIRYNRRTHELRIERNDYNWETSNTSNLQ